MCKKRRINFFIIFPQETSIMEKENVRKYIECCFALEGIKAVGFYDAIEKKEADYPMEQAMSWGVTLQEACDFTITTNGDGADFCLNNPESFNRCIERCTQIMKNI